VLAKGKQFLLLVRHPSCCVTHVVKSGKNLVGDIGKKIINVKGKWASKCSSRPKFEWR